MDDDRREGRKDSLDFRIFAAETIIYRKNQNENLQELKSDVKEIKVLLSKLPCPQQTASQGALKSKVTLLQWFFAVVVLVLFFDILKFHMR